LSARPVTCDPFGVALWLIQESDSDPARGRPITDAPERGGKIDGHLNRRCCERALSDAAVVGRSSTKSPEEGGRHV
jgi:hypothetical protein